MPPVFALIARCGRVDTKEMRRVFNLGVGMIMIVSAVSAAAILGRLRRAGCPSHRVGRIVKGKGEVRWGKK